MTVSPTASVTSALDQPVTCWAELRILVGFRATTPHDAAESRDPPAKSTVIAIGANPEATAAAAPPFDPPAKRERLCGLREVPSR